MERSTSLVVSSLDKSQIGAFEAKNHLALLLDRVEQGEVITITRRGVPVARLCPVVPEQPDKREAIEALKRFRKGNRLGGISVRELIEEGRRA